jgi:UDP-N-acetylmuramoyl-L-alanyl-D-glutamate--2,6-diaminopimelate ligase
VKRLRQVIELVEPESVVGFTDVPVSGVACHPSGVTAPGFIFVCMDEYLEYNRWQTWRTHLEALEGLGLAAVLAPERIDGLPVPQLLHASPRTALGRLARDFSGEPDADLRLIGVTGTNGKTTTVRLMAHLLSGVGNACGSIGTLGVELGGRFSNPGTYTTPLATELYGDLAKFRDAGARSVAMEVSSHALALDRVEGLSFDGAILTNVERDHLDFHGTQTAYAEAKRRLFKLVRPSGWCVLNRQSAYWEAFAETATGQVVTYGPENSGADFEFADLALQSGNSSFTVSRGPESCRFSTQLAGSFQVENAVAAISLANLLGYPLQKIADVLGNFPPVTGRMEQIVLPNGATAIVDYAHNPDGLRHVLSACRPFCEGKLHAVFGCGGDRDKGKRPLMGKIAADLADVCWVTSDNPRTEDPDAILEDILAGMTGGRAVIQSEVDRAAAIHAAYQSTTEGDVLLIAGKGHEDYQIIGHTKHFFSDQAILRDLPGQRPEA